MPHFRDLPGPFRIALAASICAGLAVLWPILTALFSGEVGPGFADKDFANYWIAGRLVLEHRASELFGPQPAYFSHLQAAFGPDYPWHNWSYPPHYLLAVWPLGFFGYTSAMVLFLAATGLFFAWALHALAGRGNPTAWVAAAPFVVHNVWAAQNGFLTAGLALGGLALRERRPVLAGILIGFLTVKPQLGLLFPLLLLAERRWLTIASAAVSACAFIALSAVLFGLDAWQGYLREVVPYQALVMRALEGRFLTMLPSVYGSLRDLGVEAGAALAIHGAVALIAAIAAVLAFIRVGDDRWRSVVLLVATFLVTPYALSYDLGLLAGGLALVLSPSLARPDHSERERIVLTAAMLLPLIIMPLGAVRLPLAPIILGSVLLLALRRSGAWGRKPARLPPASV